jgi:PAS domain S-box-containing protein
LAKDLPPMAAPRSMRALRFRPAEPEDRPAAAVLAVMACGIAVVALIWMGAGALLPYPFLRLALASPALFGAVLALGLVRAGALRAAGWALVLSMWLALTASLLVESQLFSAAGYVVTIFAAGLFLGRRAILLTGALAMVATGALGFLHEAGALASLAVLQTPRLTWLGGLLCVLAGAALVAIGADHRARALERARRDEEALAQRNRELAASEERFRLLAENAQDIVIELGDGGRPSYVSPSIRALTGHPPETLLGRDPREVVGELIHAEDLPRMAGVVEGIVEGRPMGPVEYRLRRADGGWIWLETITQAYRTADGSVRGLAIARDVTARRLAEAGLRESERRLRLLIEDSPFPISVYDGDGRPLLVNRAFQRLFGMAPEDAERFLAEFALFDDPRLDPLGVRGDLERAKAGEVVTLRGVAFPTGLRRYGQPPEPRLWLNAVIYPLKDAEGRVEQLVLMLEDTTEARRLEEQLRQAQKMEALGTLAGGIAHDLNNVLSPILGYAELALDASPPGSPNAEYLTQILESAERAKALVRQILAFSRTAEPERRPLALRAVVQEALGLLRASLPATTAIRAQLGEGGDHVVGNPTELYQLVLNLGTNAAQALDDERGTIEVLLEPVDLESARAVMGGVLAPGPWVHLCVRDDGLGMDADTVRRIFDPFFTTKRASQGTGLGLSVVYGIVTRHGGGIHVESAPEKGSAFEIWLPRVAATAAADLAGSAPPLRGSERILLVDDEPAVGRVLRDALQTLGYRVRVETDPRAALAAFAAAPRDFDLVVTDQTMPGLTGEGLARELHALRPDLPILLCTGFYARLDEARARGLGIRECLMKPLRSRELGGAIRRVLDA